MAARKGARWLAPIALAATAAAIYIVVHQELAPHRAKDRPPVRQAVTHTGHTTTVSHKRTHATAYYVVKSGDTLSSIALKTHVPLSTLENLNPSVNPSALQTGQRLVLRRG